MTRDPQYAAYLQRRNSRATFSMASLSIMAYRELTRRSLCCFLSFSSVPFFQRILSSVLLDILEIFIIEGTPDDIPRRGLTVVGQLLDHTINYPLVTDGLLGLGIPAGVADPLDIRADHDDLVRVDAGDVGRVVDTNFASISEGVDGPSAPFAVCPRCLSLGICISATANLAKFYCVLICHVAPPIFDGYIIILSAQVVNSRDKITWHGVCYGTD